MSSFASLATECVLLCPWKESDYTPFCAMSENPLVYEYVPPFAGRAQCDAFVDSLRQEFALRGWGIWTMELKGTAQFMGMAGIHEPGPEFGVPRPCVEIGWRLAPVFWGVVTAAPLSTA